MINSTACCLFLVSIFKYPMDQNIRTPSNDREKGERLKMVFEDLNKNKKRYERLRTHRVLSAAEQIEYDTLCSKLSIFYDKCKLFIKPRKNGPGKFLVDTYVSWCENQRASNMLLTPILNQCIPDQEYRNQTVESPHLRINIPSAEKNEPCVGMPISDELAYLEEINQKYGFKSPFAWSSSSNNTVLENNTISATRNSNANRSMEYVSPINRPEPVNPLNIRNIGPASPFIPFDNTAARNQNPIAAKMNARPSNFYKAIHNHHTTAIASRPYHHHNRFFENQSSIGAIPEKYYLKNPTARSIPNKEDNTIKASTRRSTPTIVNAIPRNLSGVNQYNGNSSVSNSMSLQPILNDPYPDYKGYVYHQDKNVNLEEYTKPVNRYFDGINQQEAVQNKIQRAELGSHVDLFRTVISTGKTVKKYKNKSPVLKPKSPKSINDSTTSKNKMLMKRGFESEDSMYKNEMGKTSKIIPAKIKKRKQRSFHINSNFSQLINTRDDSNDTPRIGLGEFVEDMQIPKIDLEKIHMPILTMLDSVYHRILGLSGMIAQNRTGDENVKKDDILFAFDRIMKDFKPGEDV